MKPLVTPIYLDFAAATPVDSKVTAAMLPYFTDDFYNPSALYSAAKKVYADYQQAREQAAELLQVRPAELIFTAGSTEANNLAINGVMQQYPQSSVAVSAIEHDSVLHTALQYGTILLPVNQQGILDVAASTALIAQDTVLVSCMLVNNEVGTIQPVADLAKQLQKIREKRAASGNKLPLYLHCDASQAFNYLHVLPHQLGVDLLVLGGSKIYGPKQTAFLYVRSGVALRPQIVGGGQELGIRSGTQNVAGMIGLVKAMQLAADMRVSEVKRLSGLLLMVSKLLQEKLPQAKINGSLKHRVPNNIHITIEGTDNETVVYQLDELGIQVAAGSACSASSDEPSHVLKAMGLSDLQAQASLRATMGRATTPQHVKQLVTALITIVG